MPKFKVPDLADFVAAVRAATERVAAACDVKLSVLRGGPETGGQTMSDPFAEYGSLLERFLSGDMSAMEFRSTYLDCFKTELRRLDEPLFEPLDGLFGDVDSFTPDPRLLAENPEFYLDEKRLRDRVRTTASRMSALRN